MLQNSGIQYAIQRWGNPMEENQHYVFVLCSAPLNPVCRGLGRMVSAWRFWDVGFDH